MLKNILHFGIASLMICVVMTGCKKTDATATSSTDPQLAFTVATDNPTVTFTTAAAGKPAFVWTAGMATITRIQLSAMHGGIASQYSTGTLADIDLFALSQSNISIPKGDYTTAKVAVFFTQTTTTDLPLTLKGNFTTAGGALVPLEFDMNDNLEIDVAVSNIIADGTKNFTNSISMHLNTFLNNVAATDLDAAARTNGVILISKTINTALYTKIKANMAGCAGTLLTSTPK